MKYTLTDSSSPLTYYYTHNSRGDIVGIYNEAGELRAHYEYDAWGNVLSVTDQNGNAITSATHIGNLKPFRYRGYYLDTETGLYYLMSRYYDPVTHRFINADGYFQSGGGILDANMSAYCGNNPVSRSDSTGERYEQYAGAGGGFYVSGGGYGGGTGSSYVRTGLAVTATATLAYGAAVGYSMGKQVYCFPWFSRSRLDYFAYNLIYCIETLKNLNMIVITPIGL